MGMRCPDCMRFRSLDFGDGEVDSIEIDVGKATDGKTMATINAEVRIPRNCQECSTEMKVGSYSSEVEVEIEQPKCTALEEDGQTPKPHDLSIEADGEPQPDEGGGGRYKKNMISYTLDFVISCGVCDFTQKGYIEDAMAASEFEEQ